MAKEHFVKIAGSEILETSDYSKFKFDLKNRPISQEKVNMFFRDFQKGNFFLKDFPAVVTKNFVVLDAQHRIKACEKAGLPVYFRFAEDLAIENVVSVQKNAGWKTNDYIHAFIQQANQNYIILNRFIKRYNISPGVAINLLHNKEGQSGGDGLTKSGFYDGTFEVRDETQAHLWAKNIIEIGEFAPHVVADRGFWAGMTSILGHPDYDQKRMVQQMENYGVMLKRQLRTTEYVRNLEEVFNYRLRQENKVRFT